MALYCLNCAAFGNLTGSSRSDGWSLRVSSVHRAEFATVFDRERYANEELDTLFARLDAHADDAYCTVALQRNDLTALRGGCRNFYEMNDYRPDRDFRLLRRLYTGDRFDCYSVGLLQPYIMHSELGCTSLTMLDIDWRIHAVHHELLQSFRAGRFARANAAAQDAVLAGVELAYPAFGFPDTRARRAPARLKYLCRSIQQEYCATVLPEFQATVNAELFDSIQLELAALHDAAFAQPDDRRRIVYLSNAIEDAYTSDEQFRLMLANLRATSGNVPDVLVHHVGGWKLFGLYAVSHAGGVTRVRTVCRDPYLSRSRGADGEAVRYETWFERYALNEGRAPTCAELLAELTFMPGRIGAAHALKIAGEGNLNARHRTIVDNTHAKIMRVHALGLE